jgi:hypothetical protein
MATVQEVRPQERLATWDLFYSLDMAIACFISYSQ